MVVVTIATVVVAVELVQVGDADQSAAAVVVVILVVDSAAAVDVVTRHCLHRAVQRRTWVCCIFGACGMKFFLKFFTTIKRELFSPEYGKRLLINVQVRSPPLQPSNGSL